MQIDKTICVSKGGTRRNADGYFICECGSHEFVYTGGCGDSGGIDEGADCIECGKAWAFDNLTPTGDSYWGTPTIHLRSRKEQ